jgi:hypothetical protein
MESFPVFRVRCTGPLIDDQRDVVADSGVHWEGTFSGPGQPDRHRLLTGASSSAEAVAKVAAVLSALGVYENFEAEAVLRTSGEPVRTPIRLGFAEVPWDDVLARCAMTSLQQVLVHTILDRGEPTWVIASDPDVQADRDSIEAAMVDLEQRGIVYRSWEESGETGDAERMCNWWALTDEAWDLLGLVKSPHYR